MLDNNLDERARAASLRYWKHHLSRFLYSNASDVRLYISYATRDTIASINSILSVPGAELEAVLRATRFSIGEMLEQAHDAKKRLGLLGRDIETLIALLEAKQRPVDE